MPQMLGPTLLRRQLRRKHSANRVERAWFRRHVRRMRAWVDLLLGSSFPTEDKDAVLREGLVDVLTGRACAKLYESEKEFDKDLRCFLQERCAVLLGGPGM